VPGSIFPRRRRSSEGISTNLKSVDISATMPAVKEMSTTFFRLSIRRIADAPASNATPTEGYKPKFRNS
jgi:hypothetical protein